MSGVFLYRKVDAKPPARHHREYPYSYHMFAPTMKAKLLSFIAALATVSTTFLPFAASAAAPDSQAISPGDLIKCASLSSVYYFAPDGKRYVFPNEKTYFTWYTNFDGVKAISDRRCSTLPLGRGNITYRPGVKMVKITTDPRTYAVERGGILRHITTAQIAETLFGLNWKSVSMMSRIHSSPTTRLEHQSTPLHSTIQIL